jgi:hypothetical protein
MDFIKLWGEYSESDRTFQIGVEISGNASPLPDTFRIKGIWTEAALWYYIKNVINYCIQNKIRVHVNPKTVVVE